MSWMKQTLTSQILVALLVGFLVGWYWPPFGRQLQILATIFIRLVLVILAPLVFATLVVGIAGQGGLRRLGSLTLQTLVLYLLITCIALGSSFFLANLVQPGRGIAVNAQQAAAGVGAPPAESFWIRLVPRSVVDAMARGDVLQIVVFSVLFAVAVSSAGKAAEPVLELCRSLAHIMYRFTDIVMMAAPIGVFGAAAALASQQGLQIGAGFVRLIAIVYIGLALLLLVFFPALALLFRIPLRKLFQAAKEPFAIAFATASGSAALPKAMENMEAFGVPRSIASFTIGTGLNFNSSGSTVFIGAASLFILQAFNAPQTLKDQWVLFGTLFLVSKGIAAVPRASLVVIAAALPSVGLAPELVGAGVGLLLGIDPLTDMPRTAVNAAGHCLSSAVIAKWQGALREDAAECCPSMSLPKAAGIEKPEVTRRE
jgi:proton glutamate symport protein